MAFVGFGVCAQIVWLNVLVLLNFATNVDAFFVMCVHIWVTQSPKHCVSMSVSYCVCDFMCEFVVRCATLRCLRLSYFDKNTN